MSTTLDRPRLTRDKVIDAAADIASRDGAEALSMRRLADELEVSTMAAYRHVPSKQALIDALLLRALDIAKEMTERQLRPGVAWADAAPVAVWCAWHALDAYPGLRFELRNQGDAREAWAGWLNYTLVGLLVGMDSVDRAEAAARAVVS